MNTTRLVPEAVEYGDVPETFVTGLASISRVSAGVIRETFYVERELSDGRIEKVVVLCLLWDADQWFAARRSNSAAEMGQLMHHKPQPVEATAH
jgi:hypothetical protein